MRSAATARVVPDLPHFERATRRAFLRQGLAVTGAFAAVAWLDGCSKDDAATFATSTTTAGSTTTVTTTADTQARPATTSPSTVTGSDVAVSFTYTAADGGRVRNPYIAAWIEDDTSTMVGLISVRYLARKAKYLRELTQFSAAATDLGTDQIDAVSGGTRLPGEYHLSWDGRGLDGTVLIGKHTLWIEAAREHGPHSVTNGPVTLGQAGSTTIAGNGELSDAVVTVA